MREAKVGIVLELFLDMQEVHGRGLSGCAPEGGRALRDKLEGGRAAQFRRNNRGRFTELSHDISGLRSCWPRLELKRGEKGQEPRLRGRDIHKFVVRPSVVGTLGTLNRR